MKKRPFLNIQVSRAGTSSKDPDVTIHWDGPAPTTQKRDKIYNAIHALLAALGPVPRGNWEVTVRAEDIDGYFKRTPKDVGGILKEEEKEGQPN